MRTQATATKATFLLAIGLGWAALGCSGSALEDGRASTDRTTFPESSRAAFRLAELAKAFPVLGAASPARFREVEKGRVRAELSGDTAARVTLPATIDGWVELEDVPSRLGIRFARIGTGSAPLGVNGGLALYSHADAPVDEIHRVLPAGVEDFIAFGERPPVETLSYRVEVTRVAGLRLVSATLEFLDASGTPRLRVAPPYFLDRSGKRHSASLGVAGCRFDTDPRGPWGRPTVAPGAATCVLSVRWKADDYPILVDPLWTTTDDMAVGRTQLSEVALLPSGRVLVAGGVDAGAPLRFAEIYDPETGTFADAAAMSVPRGQPGISALQSGKILVTGGWGGGSSWHASAEIYDEGTGEWSTTADSMSSPREAHSQNVLLSGKVLIAGGSTGTFLSSTELFNPADESFTDSDGLEGIRSLHTGTLLSDGKVLVAGGENTNTAELYNPADNTFSMTGAMSANRGQHAAVSLGSGKALIVGGWDGTIGMNTNMPVKTAEIYDVATGRFTTTGMMAEARRWPTATLLDSGQVLVVGGTANDVVGLTSAELFDPTAGTSGMFSSALAMMDARFDHAAIKLMNGSVLVMGGRASTSTQNALSSASLYQDKSNGSSCAVGDECRSTFCVEGVCCESACTGGLTCVSGACGDGGSGAGGDASGGSSGSGTGGSAGSNPTGGSATGGSSGTGTTTGGSTGSGGDAPGAGGDDSGTACSQDSDCAADHYCNGEVCVPRTPLESACGCTIPGRRAPSGALLACALLGGGIVLRRRVRPIEARVRSRSTM